jgi:ectoine hydroxylase-related dioxygenase (phytanoyl-CoA dioxygenase family)
VHKPRLAAGDLLIWTSQLLHGNGHNVSKKPRLCQYVSMNPANEQNDELRQQRIAAWRGNTHPAARAFPGDPRGIEERRDSPAELTNLGRKLLGVDSWD